ncbi:hypothetical protein BDZ91DRAFT_730795 [Kalaharituber pfeilii]|nr:hypothetical protein BDZ91DRAFT_730795 [Kalaharituber pfeilii]
MHHYRRKKRFYILPRDSTSSHRGIDRLRNSRIPTSCVRDTSVYRPPITTGSLADFSYPFTLIPLAACRIVQDTIVASVSSGPLHKVRFLTLPKGHFATRPELPLSPPLAVLISAPSNLTDKTALPPSLNWAKMFLSHKLAASPSWTAHLTEARGHSKTPAIPVALIDHSAMVKNPES